EIIEADARESSAIAAASRGCDVLLHAANPPLTRWSKLALPLAYSAIDAAEAAGTTILFPGNLYNFGSPLPALIDEQTPMRPSTRKGRLRVTTEQRMAEAAER